MARERHYLMNPVYKDPNIRVEDRVKDLINQMTVEEKIRQLTSIWLTFDPDKGDMAPSPLGGFAGSDPRQAFPGRP